MKRDLFNAGPGADDGWSRTVHLPRAGIRHALADGTRVGEVEIDGVIGEGSAGIVYLATDPSLERRVAVKEYLPSVLASRAADGRVVVRSEGLMTAFRAGLDSFIAEARLLARFEHPSLVKVFRVWEANGTAYLAMPYYEGPTLARALAERGEPPDEVTLRAWLDPLLGALDMIHAAGQLHRDISADNILLTPTGPVLLDFGVVRRAIGGSSHAPTLVLKRGFAPIEQYGESDALQPGPWTDLYALGSVLHLAITGEAPTISVERLWDDWLEPLASVARGRYSPALLATVDAMLAVRPAQRPQDVLAVRRLLDATDAASEPTQILVAPAARPFADIDVTTEPPTAVERPITSTRAAQAAAMATGSRRSLVLAACSVALALGVGLAVRSLTASVERAEAPKARPVAIAMPPAVAVQPAPTPVETPPVRPIASAVERPVPTVARSVPRTATASEKKPLAAAAPAVVVASLPMVATAAPLPTAASAHWPARCFDLLQKASLERIGDEETAFLRDTCR